ncbi:MAG: hypothetical protein U1E60_27265 [Reyranellaceae bacterium]
MAKSIEVPTSEAGRLKMLPYWMALGEFVDSFARLETVLKHFLIRMLSLNDEVGRVVTAGLRADTLAAYILRVNELTPLSATDSKFVEEAIKHFSAINTVRNSILHSGVSDIHEEQYRITNMLTARTPRHEREFFVTPEKIQGMSDDLVRLLAYFGLHAVRTEVAAPVRASLQPVLNRAWQSKPLELMNRSPENHRDSQR